MVCFRVPSSPHMWIFTLPLANSRIFWRQPPQGVQSRSPVPITAISAMDNSDALPLAYEIGTAAATKFVKPEHLGLV